MASMEEAIAPSNAIYHEQCRLLGRDAVLFFLRPDFRANVWPLSGLKESAN
jgi:hypothetical protein